MEVNVERSYLFDEDDQIHSAKNNDFNRCRSTTRTTKPKNKVKWWRLHVPIYDWKPRVEDVMKLPRNWHFQVWKVMRLRLQLWGGRLLHYCNQSWNLTNIFTSYFLKIQWVKTAAEKYTLSQGSPINSFWGPK